MRDFMKKKLVLLGGIVLAFLLISPVLAYNPDTDDILFESDFEDSLPNEWDTHDGGHIRNNTATPIPNNTYCVQSTDDNFAFTHGWNTSLMTNNLTVWVQFEIRWSGLNGTGVPNYRNIVNVFGDHGDMVGLGIDEVGDDTVFMFWSLDIGNYYCATVLQNDTWYEIDLFFEKSETAQLYFYLDGVQEGYLAGNNSDEYMDAWSDVSLYASGTLGWDYEYQFVDYFAVGAHSDPIYTVWAWFLPILGLSGFVMITGSPFFIMTYRKRHGWNDAISYGFVLLILGVALAMAWLYAV